ncbi:MAG: hypothetical protein R3A44_21295 [Caldilineaceae bacterium]
MALEHRVMFTQFWRLTVFCCLALFFVSCSPLPNLYAVEGPSTTQLVYPREGKEFAPVVTAGTPLINVLGVTYFVEEANSRLWRTDGTPAGTYSIEALFPGRQSGYFSLFGQINDLLLVRITGDGNEELWSTDGLKDSKLLLSFAGEGKNTSVNIGYGENFEFEGRFYFAIQTITYNDLGNVESVEAKLWRTDGTEENTQSLDVLFPTVSISNGRGAAQLSNSLFFQSYEDAVPELAIWRLDAQGVQKVQSFERDPTYKKPVWAGPFVAFGDYLYFFLQTMDGRSGVWRIDQTGASLEFLVERPPAYYDSSVIDTEGIFVESLTALTDHLLFLDRRNQQTQLWSFDPKQNKAILVSTLVTSSYRNETTFATTNMRIGTDNKLYLNLLTESGANELWASDGTATGTQLVAEGGSPFASSYIAETPSGIVGLGIDGAAASYLYIYPLDGRSPFVIRNLGGFFTLYPRIYRFGHELYFTARDPLPLGTVYLWHMDLDALNPSNTFLPIVH